MVTNSDPKHRNLVAASNVADYLDRVRELSKPDDDNQHVFVTNAGWEFDEKPNAKAIRKL